MYTIPIVRVMFQYMTLLSIFLLQLLLLNPHNSVESLYNNRVITKSNIIVKSINSPDDSNIKILPNSDSYSNLKFSILGGGAFSLALAKVLSYKSIPTTLLVRSQSVADHINKHRHHPKYLCDSKIPETVWATANMKEAVENADYLVHAVPMQNSREFLVSMKPYIFPGVPILSVTKGVEQGTFSLMNDIIVGNK